MNNLFMIAKNNMKKQKGDMITFFILTMISTFLIFNSVSDLLGISKAYDKRFEEVNMPDIIFTSKDNDICRDSMEEAFEKSSVDEYEVTPLLYGELDYKNKDDENYQNYLFLFERFDEEPEMMDVIPEGLDLGDDDILIPLTMADSFKEGDTLVFKIDGNIYEFNVAGFSENPGFCSSMNIAIDYVYISAAAFDEFAALDTMKVERYCLFKGIVEDETADLDMVEQEISEEYKRIIATYQEQYPEMDLDNGLSVNLDLLKMGNTILPYVVGSVILVFALLILVISLISISFSINNFIQKNMKNTGIMEACGYTISELRNALTLQIMSVSSAGVAAGIILSVFTIPQMGAAFTLLLGITWDQKISIPAALITVGVILLTILITVRILSRKYNGITVLDALRGGINAHNFRKNYFPLEKTSLPLPLTLSLKETFGSIRKNIAMVVIVAILTIATLIGFGMMENFSVGTALFDIMGGEWGDAQVIAENGISDDLRDVDGVENVYACQEIEMTVEYDGGSHKYRFICAEDMSYALNTVMIDGRCPESDNEIMLTWTAANEIGAQIGDVITVKAGDTSEDFVITGLNQRMQNAGRTGTMTLDGLERMGMKGVSTDYYITSEEGVSFETIQANIEEYAEDKGINLKVSDTAEVLEGTLAGVNAALKVIGILMAVLTALIIIFVESLVIRAKITREWRGMGINKALGMSSADLISQIALSNIPAIIAGCIFGSLLSGQVGKATVMAVFSYMGIKKIAFDIPLYLMAATALGIILIAVLTSAAAGLKVRKLIPMEMITEE